MLRRVLIASLLYLSATIIPASAAPIAFPSGLVPFSSIYYQAGPDKNGNFLIEGFWNPLNSVAGLEAITPAYPGQQFSDSSIQLAPGHYFSNVYIPTSAELNGIFSGIDLPVLNPYTAYFAGNTLHMNQFVGNDIPGDLLFGPFAFEIGPATSPTPEPNAAALLAVAAAFLGMRAFTKKDSRPI